MTALYQPHAPGQVPIGLVQVQPQVTPQVAPKGVPGQQQQPQQPTQPPIIDLHAPAAGTGQPPPSSMANAMAAYLNQAQQQVGGIPGKPAAEGGMKPIVFPLQPAPQARYGKLTNKQKCLVVKNGTEYARKAKKVAFLTMVRCCLLMRNQLCSSLRAANW